MAQGKLDLPDDLLSSKPSSDHSWTSKVEGSGGSEQEKVNMGLLEDSKDQVVSDNSIPLSPQWLYNRPSETKMDLRPGNSTDPNQKDGWRLDGSEDKKDWRRVATDNESSRRWREEERETGLLGARRDRRKVDRRVDSISNREIADNRALPSSDRWHDGVNRNTGHDARRDSKWSSRWGPEDKEKESRTEKRTDGEKEKEDAQNDNQSSIMSNRSASERDSDSRDKWRPRHRMEVNSTGSSSYRAAPGFGVERGRVEGSYSGFTLGRGRSSGIGRSSSIAAVNAAQSNKTSVIGKPSLTTNTFCYPRGKLLDIYRRQKLDSLLVSMPDEMEEPPLTQVNFVEPLAFVIPDAEEEVLLNDIWKGKITSSGVSHDFSRKGRSTEYVSGSGDWESCEEKQGTLPSFVTEEGANDYKEAAGEVAYQTDTSSSLWENGSHFNLLKEFDNGRQDTLTAKRDTEKGLTDEKETESATSFDVKSKLPDDSSLLFDNQTPEQNISGNMEQLSSNNEAKDPERGAPLEEVYLYYIDPHGQTQGPFLGADIMLWFEEGYFGTDLPVRMANAPDGTPFQTLGEVMPHLQVKGENPGSEFEQSIALAAKLDPILPFSSAPEITTLSNVKDPGHPLETGSDLKNLSAQLAQSRVSEAEAPFQQPHSEGQSFLDFVAQDEEIVFPGRPGCSGCPTLKSSGNPLDPLSNSHPSLPNEMRESGLPYQNDNKLHPFGLLWSELEGSHARFAEVSDTHSSMERAAQFGARTDPITVSDKWPDAYRQDARSSSNSFQDTISAHHLSRVQAESNNFDLAEQLMMRQLHHQQQQQLQQRNILTPHARLSESILDHVPIQNLIHHQQLGNLPAPELEHLLALEQLQQQRQLQIQQQQLQQQQQYHQQQKLLQEREQSQVQQVLLEQLLHGQLPDHGIPQSRINPGRAKAVDQVLLEQQLLHDLQQRSHLPPSHFVPSVEQLTQAKFGQPPQQEQQRDLFELLSRAQHGQMQSLEHQILHQEQLRARQLSMGLRQRASTEEERFFDAVWPSNESDQFLRSVPGNQRAQSSGISPLDFYQRQQRPVHEDQLSHLERNLSFQDRLRQGLYESGSVPFERSLSMPSGVSGMNMDVVNAMVHGHNLDMQELSARMQSAGQMGSFPSTIRSHNPNHPIVPNQFQVSHLDGVEGHWPESNGQLANDWTRIQQLHMNAERQKRESEVKVTSQERSLWMADQMNDDKSRRLLMDLLHPKSGQQPADPLLGNNGIPFDKRAPSGLYTGSSSLDHPFSSVSDREAALNNSFAVGSYGSNASESAEVYLASERINNLGSNDNLPFRSESLAMSDAHPYLSGISETAPGVYTDSNITDRSSINRDYFEMEGRMHGSKGQSMTKGSVSDITDGATSLKILATGQGEIPINPLSRHSSLGVSGFYGDKAGPHDSFVEDKTINQMPVPSKGQENILLRRPPVPRATSSQEGLSEMVLDGRGKSSLNSTDGVNPVNQGSDITPSSKKDVRFRRTSSCSDADVSEPLFIDMLKSNGKKSTTQDIHGAAGYSEVSDGTQGGKSGKKKGKKGRQIDPALLGFKVTSNRIMMGEIQRIDD